VEEAGAIHKLRQKDLDAKWTRKGGVLYYGYKDHIKADADSKLVADYAVTSASVHDSQMLTGMIDERDTVLYADSVYWGKTVADALPEGVENRIQERGTKHITITEEQRKNNRINAQVRCRVEHIFGFMSGAMHGMTVRSIGLARAEFNIGLSNLIYNLCRYEFLHRPKKAMG